MDVTKLSKAGTAAKAAEKAADLARVADKATDLAKAADKAVELSKAALAADSVKLSDKVADASKVAKEAAEALVHRGTKTDPTPLFKALKNSDTGALDDLIKTGFDLNGADRFGQTALHKVSFDGQNDLVKKLLDAGADPLVADTRNRTPLFWAAARGEKEAAKTLLDAGSNPNVADVLGNGALDVAMKRGHGEIAQLLEASGAKPSTQAIAKPFTGKLDFSDPNLQLFNDEIALMRTNPSAVPLETQLEKSHYADVFDDPDLLARNRKMVTDWSTWLSNTPEHQALRGSWKNLLEGKAPTSAMDQTMFDTVTTRKERWQNLSAQTGIPVPESFQAYRGVHGEYFVGNVVEAWADESSKTMIVPSNTLTSWSLDKNTAEYFAYDFGGRHFPNGAIFETDIPFDMTVFDKWADDGNFITTFDSQHEVVVGTLQPDSLAVPKEKVSVRYLDKVYTYDQRQELIDTWKNTASQREALYMKKAPLPLLWDKIKSWFKE